MKATTVSSSSLKSQGSLQVKDAVCFVREHKLFKNWTDEQIVESILRAIESGGFFWTAKERKLESLIIAYVDQAEKTIHVAGIAGKLKPFLDHYKKNFHSFRLTSYRRGRLKHYTL